MLAAMLAAMLSEISRYAGIVCGFKIPPVHARLSNLKNVFYYTNKKTLRPKILKKQKQNCKVPYQVAFTLFRPDFFGLLGPRRFLPP